MARGRAYIYGLGAYGEAGVRQALDSIYRELDTTMALCGERDVKNLGHHNLLHPPGTGWARQKLARSVSWATRGDRQPVRLSAGRRLEATSAAPAGVTHTCPPATSSSSAASAFSQILRRGQDVRQAFMTSS